ncbi:MAG: hypothetical protein CMA23_003635 [Methanobacteriota archaeon]|nr:MAG: hypothetical protein CBE15_05225 [Euryarchaeota archaeon TMED255]RAH10659.1 MAG: hypothetical protein CMA23_003635 [Euryarchaeota archaeon]
MSESGWESLHSKVQLILEERKWTPTPIQSAAMGALLNGDDALLVAPTGSGKTESAILPIVSNTLNEGSPLSSILYITPLRALNRDVERRLPEICEPLGLTVGLRHGDTPQNERQKQSRKPPHLWITTPETLQIMLLGSRLREHLKSIQTVIIDEVHDLAASERGSQLLLGLERLDALTQTRLQRIGLSATVGNPKEISRWLSRKSTVIRGDAPRETDIRVHAPEPGTEDRTLSKDWGTSAEAVASFRHVARLVEADRPALIFVNSRNAAETVALRMRSVAPDLEIGVHHGSLARETRTEMENRLQKGEIDALICTSSMELGIDVGSIKRVHQIESPRAVDRMLQRVGRAEHILGGVGRGDLIAWKSDDIAEGVVIGRRAIVGDIEPIGWRDHPRNVATNQLVLLTLQEGWVRCDQATLLLERCHLFEGWTHHDTMELLRLLDDRRMIRLVEDIAKSDPFRWPPVLWKMISAGLEGVPEERPRLESLEQGDPEKHEHIRRVMRSAVPKELKEHGWFGPGAKTAEVRNRGASMIPDSERYLVRDAVTRAAIGSLDEAFVMGIRDEDDGPTMFVMAGRTWMIIDADPEASELTVAPAALRGEAPVWFGELPPVPAKVAREVGRLRLMVANEIGGLDMPVRGEVPHLTGGHIDTNLGDYHWSDEAKNRFVTSVIDHLDSTGCIPHAGLWTIEQRSDAIVLNTCQGTRINQTLSDLMQAMASMIDGKIGVTIVDPYRIHLKIPGLTIPHLERILLETRPDAVESILRMTTPNSRALRSRVVEVAKIMGVIQRGIDPRSVNVQGIIKRYQNGPLVNEALDKLFHERLDLDGTQDVLRALQDGYIGLNMTASGTLGRSERAERDLLLPTYSDKEIREQVEERLLNERIVQICLNCGDITRRRVARFPERSDACVCGGRLRATAVESLESRLRDWVADEEPKTRQRMMKNAEIIADRGLDAVLCLVARGVGEQTAIRILSRVEQGDRLSLLRAIHDAEINYARTSRYWS